ncbi:DASS family sodium-coupled anion symporter [Oleispirillum naphthae]|uniref:DASS family sodium-coupled anion symporter n=1 Tax=Oleispirillum naphthae TaxID=2838853 RepID=UPI003082589F
MSDNPLPAKSRLLFSAGLPILVMAALWLLPVPAGLSVKAWHMFAIFAAMICGILTQPLPSGAVMIVALSVAIFTGTLSQGKALVGFSNGTVWLIFCAYVLSLAFIKSGLGRRVAYKLVSMFGGSSLGIAYALGITDLIIAPATPSVTARSGGIIFPVARAINEVLGSGPGPTGKKIGDFLTMCCFQVTPITGAMFLTGMAANPLAASLAKQNLDIEISWGGWVLAAAAPCLASFVLTPLLVYALLRPELKRTPEAREMGKTALAEMGALSHAEKLVGVGFVLGLLGWGTSLITHLSATTVAFGLVAYLLATGTLEWKDILKDHAAWDTVIWFAVIISLATGLTDLGFVKWMTTKVGAGMTGWSWMTAFIVLCLGYVYVHYMFATASGHVAALFVPFTATAIAAGTPPLMAAMAFGILSNLMWGITEYAGGPGPIYFAQGYFQRPRFYSINFVVVSVNVALTLSIGLIWWKIIGYW